MPETPKTNAPKPKPVPQRTKKTSASRSTAQAAIATPLQKQADEKSAAPALKSKVGPDRRQSGKKTGKPVVKIPGCGPIEALLQTQATYNELWLAGYSKLANFNLDLSRRIRCVWMQG